MSSIWHQIPSLDSLNNQHSVGASNHLDIVFVEFGDDYLTASMPVNEKTTQPYGILHGGASCLLAETVGSHASMLCIDMEKNYCVGLDINANHLRAVSSGHVYATAKPVHIGKSTHVWEILIFDDNEKLICVSRLTMMVKTGAPPTQRERT